MASTVTELLRRRFGGKKGLLPSGYTQLEYIENVSSSYILLPPISSGTKIETYFAPDLNKVPSAYACICGVNGHLQTAFYANGKAGVGNASSANAFYSNGVKAKVSATFNVSQQYTNYSVNDVDTNLKRGYTSVYNIALFGASTSMTTATYLARGKMYSFKMWNSNDELIHDLIPCIDPNNVYGMYDIVGGVFYDSANSNSPFTGG